MPTALLSVYDKSGIVEFAKGLHDLGWTIVSSGGTAAAIAADGVPVTDVVELTGVPAILGHRVVTLHPKIHGGILADPTMPDHQADMAEHDIEPIDLVVVNLYPFTSDPGIQLIDIGGPAMVRAAAKNHAFVGVVVDPADYGRCWPRSPTDGSLTASTRRRLARTAFAHTAGYDAAIVTWFDESSDDPDAPVCRRRSTCRSSCPAAAVRGEPAPAGRPLSPARPHQLVGRDDPARRQGTQLPQRVRRRGGVAVGADVRRTGLRHRQTRQPVWRGGRRLIADAYTMATRAIRSLRSAASSR